MYCYIAGDTIDLTLSKSHSITFAFYEIYLVVTCHKIVFTKVTEVNPTHKLINVRKFKLSCNDLLSSN